MGISLAQDQLSEGRFVVASVAAAHATAAAMPHGKRFAAKRYEAITRGEETPRDGEETHGETDGETPSHGNWGGSSHRSVVNSHGCYPSTKFIPFHLLKWNDPPGK